MQVHIMSFCEPNVYISLSKMLEHTHMLFLGKAEDAYVVACWVFYIIKLKLNNSYK